MSYSDYIYQERLRDVVDALKADLALATAREAALLAGLRKAVGTAREQWVGVSKTAKIGFEYIIDDAKPLLADPSPAAERLLRVVAAARARREALRRAADAQPYAWENWAADRALQDADRELEAALADMEANRG